MQTKHTQGEWVITRGANFIPSIASKELHQPIAHLCNMTDSNKFCEEAEANAKLIAAAPNLLNVAYLLSRYNTPHNVFAIQELIEKAKEAIKKATE
jgi:queuine/archaeosine tRNA-ribosyltransferase